MFADQLIAADAVENPRGARIEAARRAAIGLVAVETLRRKAYAEELLRRHSPEAPQPAGLAGQAVIVLAGRALPVLSAVAAPNLDVAASRVHRRHPVKAVAAHVHHAAAAVQVRAQAVEHLHRVILGMGR